MFGDHEVQISIIRLAAWCCTFEKGKGRAGKITKRESILTKGSPEEGRKGLLLLGCGAEGFAPAQRTSPLLTKDS